MNDRAEGLKETSSPLPGLIPVVVLGVALAYVVDQNILTASWASRAAAVSLGLVGAYIVLHWLEMILNVLALRGDPLPASLNVADRAAVTQHLDGLKGRQSVTSRARNLLQVWVLGWHPRQVMGLASFQSAQARQQLLAGSWFAIILLIVAFGASAGRPLCWCAGVALGVTLLARMGLNIRVDRYIESHLLARLPTNIPQTAMTAADLAGALGGAIQESFKKYLPQPDQMAAAMRTAVESAMQNVTGAVDKLQKSLGDNQSDLAEKWAKTLSGAASDLKGLKDAMTTASADLKSGLAATSSDLKSGLAAVTTELKSGLGAGGAQLKDVLQAHNQALEKTLTAVTTELKSGLGAGAAQLKDVLQAHNQGVEKTLASVPGQLASSYSAGASQIEAAFKQYAQQVQAAAQSLQGQLTKITEVGTQIDKVLRVQETVDGTIKSLKATEEFSRTLETLRKHVEASDALLREVARPRVIRLVESEGGVEQS